jgi:hypothetical protein
MAASLGVPLLSSLSTVRNRNQGVRKTRLEACAASLATASDRTYMRQALELAKRALGQTFPNPAVGCVLVKDGEVG